VRAQSSSTKVSTPETTGSVWVVVIDPAALNRATDMHAYAIRSHGRDIKTTQIYADYAPAANEADLVDRVR
jgi:hypothetical protein